MKKIILCFLLIVNESIFCQSSGWFFKNPQPTNTILNRIEFLNQNTAIAIGYNGTVMRTSDGGLNWSNPLSTTALAGLERLNFSVMNFFDENTGFLIGDNSGGLSKLFKTSNMGGTWSFVSQLAGNVRAMDFITQNIGWAGSGTQMLKTTDGGYNWQTVATAFPSEIRSILFLDPSTGFATASNKIFKSTDGGMNWLLVNSPPLGSFNDLYFLNSQIGFAVGSGSIIQKTTNSGATWITKLSNSLTGTLSSVYFVNSMTGFAVGGGYGNPPACIYRTTDVGETWNQIPFKSAYNFNSIGFSGNIGLMVGYGGKVARSTNQGLSWSVSPGFHRPNISFNTVSFINANTGWIGILGYTGSESIYRSTDGGSNWISVYTTSPAPSPDYLQFLNASTGYYKSYNTVYKSTNGGYNWTQLPSLNLSTTGTIKFSDVNTGMVCGYITPPIRPKLMKTLNGGNSWDTIHVPPSYSGVRAFEFINDNTGWISMEFATYPMGSYTKIYRTTDAGFSWSDLRTDTSVSYKYLSFQNNSTGWAAGGKVLKTTNGGNNWIEQQFSYANGIQFISLNTGWIIDGSGTIYKTINGGNNWYPQVDIGLAGPLAFQFINEQTGWAVGSEGMILKTTNGGDLLGASNSYTYITDKFSLLQNYPNPFNPETKIRFALPPSPSGEGLGVRLTVYDILGREVQTLVNEQLSPGMYEVEWDGTNYSSGVYYYTLTAGEFKETKRMVLIK